MAAYEVIHFAPEQQVSSAARAVAAEQIFLNRAAKMRDGDVVGPRRRSHIRRSHNSDLLLHVMLRFLASARAVHPGNETEARRSRGVLNF
jgi:hypothetical protein